MKKLLSVILVLALSSLLMLTACGGDGGEGTGGEMNAENWEEMLSAPSFENYTLYTKATIMGTEQENTVKFADGKVAMDFVLDGELIPLLYDGDEATEIKDDHEEIFLALLADFDNFIYDETAKAYKNDGSISVTITSTVEDQTVVADITMVNGVVTIDDNGNLLQFDCDYTQTTTTPEGPITMTTNMHMEFSNYGTTVIE